MSVSKVLLLMDNRGDSNWGSQATTTNLVRLLHLRFPHAEIRGVARSGTRPESGLIRHLATTLAPSIARGSRNPVAGWALSKLTQGWRRDYEWADLVVVNGEGSLHHQPQAVRWVAALLGLRRIHAKPLWVVNFSSRFVGTPSEAMFRDLLAAAEHVAIREPSSFRHVTQAGIAAIQAADCAFLTESASQQEATALMDRLGIRRPFAVMTGSASIAEWPLESQCAAVETLQEAGLDILYTASDPKDEANFARLGADITLATHRDMDFRMLTAVQREAEIVVGGRFHPTILAALVGTPFVAVPSNTQKMSGLMEMLGAEALLCPFEESARLPEVIRGVLAQRPAWSDRLRARSADLANLAGLNVPSESGVG